jgi:hypothetical protein
MAQTGFDDTSKKAILKEAVSDEVFADLRHHGHEDMDYRRFSELCQKLDTNIRNYSRRSSTRRSLAVPTKPVTSHPDPYAMFKLPLSPLAPYT